MTEEEIKTTICEYLSNQYLPVLDNHPNKKYYTGVTLDYIIEYVLEDTTLDRDYISYILLNLMFAKEIKSIYCIDIERVVFESRYSEHSGVELGTNIADVCTNYPKLQLSDFRVVGGLYGNKYIIHHIPFIQSYFKIKDQLEVDQV